MYLLPIEDVLTRSVAYLRVDPPRNGQHKHIRYASDYEIARVECVAPGSSMTTAQTFQLTRERSPPGPSRT